MSRMRSWMSKQPGRISLKRVGSAPYSSGGRPATALSPTLVASWPSNTQASVPSGLVTTLGTSSLYRSGMCPSNMSGGSTTWSSTETRIMSSICMAPSCRSSGRAGCGTNIWYVSLEAVPGAIGSRRARHRSGLTAPLLGTLSGVISPDKTPPGRGNGASSPATDRPLRRDALENRQRLLAAAGQVFEQKGLEASVADVARAAGVGMGTLYRRFPSKEALIAALVSEVLEATIAMAEEAAAWPDGSGLEHFLEASSAYQAEHLGCLPKLWNTDHHMVKTARTLIAALLADA